ncbi:MAG: HAD hydrolase family protein [Gemmatimonadaceae bacterium]|nr:HAD hydrolase family protein [Gemmatimonadaceae bacterium]
MIDTALAKRIRLVGLDVDGVLTDGGIYLGDAGGSRVELKRYDIQDGLGIKFLRDAGLKVVIVTGRVSDSVRHRALELELDDVVQDSAARKLPALRELIARHGLSLDEAAFVGDDFPDAAVLRVVGLPVCVGNAVPEIRSLCKLRLERHGGRGAVREFAELLLTARGQWSEITERYVRERSQLAEASA